MKRSQSKPIPQSQRWLVDGFCWYSKSLVRKRFATLGFQGIDSTRQIPDDYALVVFANHPGWWDPIMAMLARQAYFPKRNLYAPIEADQLERYGILKKIGFYGVELESFAGAQNFLIVSKSILKESGSSIWITPEGRFCDARDHTQPFMPGLAHLASRIERCVFLPMALEYAFWDDVKPHAFGCFGESICIENGSVQSKETWLEQLTQSLRSTQRQLSQTIIERNASAFDYLIASRPERLSWYDFARSIVSKLRGKPFDPRHSVSNPQNESR